MKYELINKNTGEKHLCEKVTIDNQDYYVSDEISKHNDWCYYAKDVDSPIKYQRGEYLNSPKIIATTNKSIDAPQIIDEVEELADKANGYNLYGKNGEKALAFNEGYQVGYNKHAETHPNSDEDMIEFTIWRSITIFDDILTPKGQFELWKGQQVKVLYFV